MHHNKYLLGHVDTFNISVGLITIPSSGRQVFRLSTWPRPCRSDRVDPPQDNALPCGDPYSMTRM